MLADKDAAQVAGILAPAVQENDAVVTVTLGGERGRSAQDLALQWQPRLRASSVTCAETVEAGCALAESWARPGDRVVVFGSFHTVAPALQWRQGRG
jgi:dihydrofolate synthase/folylpolyglutamate synthase